LRSTLDPDIVLAEGRNYQYLTVNRKLIAIVGYKEYKTNRNYMARMGDWRNDKDYEIQLDGIGGVNIMVKADVHRSGLQNALRYLI